MCRSVRSPGDAPRELPASMLGGGPGSLRVRIDDAKMQERKCDDADAVGAPRCGAPGRFGPRPRGVSFHTRVSI